MQPRVSIVMPCYNGAAHLARSVGSVLAQTMPDWELLLIDDGSTDDSRKLAADMARSDGRIHAISQANAGAVAARNRGLAEATGQYIAFLDADDTWHPEFLQVMLGALDDRPGFDIAYCGWQNIGLGGGRDHPYLPPDYEVKGKLECLVRSCPWPIHGVLLRRSLFENGVRFDQTLATSEDYDLWLRLGTKHRILRVPRVLAFYHHHDTVSRLTADKSQVALNHLAVQQKFLRSNPVVAAELGRRRMRELTLDPLLKRGFDAYWKRDLDAARTIFREVMRHGYGSPKDWTYMLPAWLPASWHRWLLARRDGTGSDPVHDA
jgi:glycosyltransferase involved in cell wall biosynthesis